MSDQSTPDQSDAELEAAERADIEQIRERLANLPNALGVAAQLNSRVLDEAAALELRTLHLVRVAAMAACGMPKLGWDVNLELMDGEVTVDDIEAVLVAIAPIIGTARYLDAVSTLLAD